MTSRHGRASRQWLRLREPADAAARSPELVHEIRSALSPGGAVVVHDLGCGTGSMGRWLAGQLPGPQRWVLYDRDAELLDVAVADPPGRASDGDAVSVEARRCDITRLEPADMMDAALVTASALLDMMTAEELERLVGTCAEAFCPVLMTLTVVGRVQLTPDDPFDQCVADAFNAHQRRMTDAGRLLGPCAVSAAVDAFERRGSEVLVRPSPWRLGPDHAALAVEWFTGWLGAACEQRPELAVEAPSYVRRRLAEAAAGSLAVTVHHEDVLVRPR